MRRQLDHGEIAIHPFIIAELALGSLRDRLRTLAYLEMLPQVEVARVNEVRQMIERNSLYRRGIGLTDAHLIASTLITPSTRLWTRDKALRGLSESLDIDADLS